MSTVHRQIFDYVETMIRADRFVAPPSELTEYVFNNRAWMKTQQERQGEKRGHT